MRSPHTGAWQPCDRCTTLQKANNRLNLLHNVPVLAADAIFGVAFSVLRFAFLALFAPHNTYMRIISERPHSIKRRPLRVRTDFAWRRVMNLFTRFFSGHRETNLTTALERQRLAKTMPGQTAALAASRLGFLIN